MILYFTRHGESTANTRRILANRLSNHPLTDNGKTQVAQLALRLKGFAISAIYSSPIQRAVETASVVSQELGLPIVLADGLREFDVGFLEGRSGFLAWAAFGHLWRSWFHKRRFTYRVRGGETFLEAKGRFLDFIAELISQYGTSDAHILCVTHGGILKIGLPYLLVDLPFELIQSYPIHNTALLKLEYTSATWHCLQWDGVILPSVK